jgi:carboxypeptidase C (cathepsin A)
MSTHRTRTHLSLSAAALILLAGTAFAQDPHAEKTTTTSTVLAEPSKPHALPNDSTTDGTVTIGGKSIAYKAVAGLIRVGANDPQDATLSLDGTTLPDSGVEPAKPG